MSQFKIGIIGCGRPWKTEKATGFGQAHAHAAGYKASLDCEIVAAADISQENLDAYCETHHVPNGYLSHQEMLAKEDLDIVSVCLWPHLHTPVSVDVAKAGVKAIHCEKPIAPTWGEAKKLVEICQEQGVQLTFNHQRRFGPPFQKAKALLDEGAIGQLTRLEAFAPNLYDWGTHWFDMLFYYNNEEPVAWLIGQIDAREGRSIFGVAMEGQGLAHYRWKNEVEGLMITGRAIQWDADAAEGLCANRLIGLDGQMEIDMRREQPLRLRSSQTSGKWETIEVEGGIHGMEHNIAVVHDLVESLKNGTEPLLAGRKALQATELIFATYESSRRRERIDLPLDDIEDSPLLTMLDEGLITTEA